MNKTYIPRHITTQKMRKKITLTIEMELVEKLDKERGDIGRSIFIQRILEKKYGKVKPN